MRILWRASSGFLWRHPWQLLLAILGIATGVAVVVAVDLANSSARGAFTLSMETVTGKATHQVVAAGPAGVPASLYTRLRVAEGIDKLAPVIEGYVDRDGKTLQLLGIDPFAEQPFRNVLPTGDDANLRALLTEPGAVLASGSTGRSFAITAEGRAYTATVVGSIGDDTATVTGAGMLITDIATAQRWLDMPGRLSRIDVIAPDAAQQERLRQLLPPSSQLLSAEGRSQAIVAMSNAFSVNLTAMSLLALLVGVFLIYNSVSFAVVQRRQLIAVLRALGVTRAQVFAVILGEGALLGTVGALLGLCAGIWLGSELLELVSRSINDLYFRMTVTTLDVDGWSLFKGFVAGLLATVIASLVPAAEAASYPPRLAMNRISVEQRATRVLPRLAAMGILLLLMTWPVLAWSGHNLVAGLLALFMLIVGMALCIPQAVSWCSRLLARRVPLPGGRLARMALSGIGDSMSRTGIAIVALAVAVSATVGVGVMVGSFRLAVSDWLDQTLQADFYVSARRGELTPRNIDAVLRIDGIGTYSSSRRVWLESEGHRVRLVALRMAPRSYQGMQLLNADPDDVWPAFTQDGAVLVSESYAFQQGLEPGDTITLPTMHGPRAFQVAAAYRSYDSNPAAVVISRNIYNMFWDDRGVDALGIYLDVDQNVGQVRAALGAAANRLSLEFSSNRELRARSLEIFDRTFTITNVLYWLATGVALVGILAAMLALQMERGRELATLRALGVTRWQLGGIVGLQSAVIGLWSGLAALPLGLAMAWVLIDVINRRAFGWSMSMVVPAAELYAALALATGSALVAGLFPAWRAGRKQPALAMRED